MTLVKANGQVYGLVVAAGVGSRFGGHQPKQYAQVAGKTILEHGLLRLAQSNQLKHLYLVVAKDDGIATQIAQHLTDDVSFCVPMTW